ncbi:MAG TPA: hypothetical protein VNZ22_15520, partial [Bacillota bacterium]|nr:hypothetical protein [Bacillota bacterium]
MNYSWANRLSRSRYLLAICAGLLLAASFPKIGMAGLAWVAPGLMIGVALGKRGWECFRIGYVAGLTHYLTSLYWLLLIPYRWHGIPFGPAAGWLALSAFIALYPATWVWLMCPRERTEDGGQAPAGTRQAVGESSAATGYGLVTLAERLLAKNWWQRTLWALAGAAVWV